MRISLCAVFLCCFGAATVALAQHAATISGTIVDPTGAVIPGATIHVEAHPPSTFRPSDVLSNSVGRYTLVLPPGTYNITVLADGFSPFTSTIALPRPDIAKYLNATLVIAPDSERLDVSSSQSSTSSADSKSAIILGPSQLATLSDDDATFQQQIEAIAGADPMQPSGVYVDGFSGGQIPSKSTIREVRINQNPYSAQFQDLGFGRVEVFTKPGSDKLHGSLMAYSNDSAFNTQNPFVGMQPPYYRLTLRGNVSGPIGKNTSYFVSGSYNDHESNSVIDALATETSNSPVNYAVPSPTISGDDSFRLDRQVTANNTFTARYELNYSSATNSGLTAPQTLQTEAFHLTSTVQTLQLSDTQNIGKNKILETRFQYIRSRIRQNPTSTAPTVFVEGYFNGGGNSAQNSRDNQDHYEFQEYFSLEHKQHFLRIGGRFRSFRDSNFSNANYNGQFFYSPSATATALSYYNVLQPSQFTITTGVPSASITISDLSLYADDEWKIRSNFTVNFGFRAETQNAIPDHFDPAPRIGAAWAIGQTAKHAAIVTLRTGFGLFYDRFGAPEFNQSGPTYLLTAVRQQSGTLQQNYVFANPSSACVTNPSPTCNGGAAAQPTLYNVAPSFRSEYQIVTGLSAEHTFKIGSISANYLHEQGVHQWTSRNSNAPLPGTYIVGEPNSGVRPLGGMQNIYQFSSNGYSDTNVLFVNTQLHPTKSITGWVYTSLRYKNGDTNGPTSFPTNQYHLADDYGRASNSPFRLFAGAEIGLPYGLLVDPLVAYLSRQPFNITIGSDLNGDTQYNDRPSFATASSPANAIYKTAYGTFDADPQPGEKIIPIDYGNGPRYVYTELSLRKIFRMGPRPPVKPTPSGKPGSNGKLPSPPPRPYQLSFSVEMDNVMNHTNASSPVGVLTSPQFGQSLSLFSAFGPPSDSNRSIFLGAYFNF